MKRYANSAVKGMLCHLFLVSQSKYSQAYLYVALASIITTFALGGQDGSRFRMFAIIGASCPTLWSYHFVVSSRWTEELLVRSKQALLKIRLVVTGIPKSGSWWLGSLKKLMDHAERIQACTLCAPASCIANIFSRLSSRAPRLQNLKISATGYYSSNLPLVLFDGDTPALRTL